jgi:hypothetical protein
MIPVAEESTPVKQAGSTMGPQFPPGYDEAMLSNLERAFNEVCVQLKVTPADADSRFIAQKLMDLAAVGITDPEELRALTLEALALRQK